MSFVSISLAIIIFLTLNVKASDPQYNLIYNISFLNSETQYYSNGLYYLGNTILNSTSGQNMDDQKPSFCEIYPTFSPQAIPWCYQSANNSMDTKALQIHFLNSYLNDSTTTVNIGTYPTFTSVTYEYSGRYLVLIIAGFVSREYNYSVMVLDLENLQTVCPKASVDQAYGASTVFTDGLIFLSGYLTKENNAVYVIVNCTTGQNYTSIDKNLYQEINLFGFNQSSVFINYYINQKNYKNTSYIQIGTLDQSYMLKFGSGINVSSFLSYNDTHFLLSYTPSQNLILGLFVISPDLQLLEVLSFTLGIPAKNINAYPIYGTSWISIQIGITTFITYDIIARDIIAVDSTIPPILLSNGTVVNLTQFGYLIQNRGGSFYFVQSPFSNPYNGIYQDPTDFNQYYTLFVPSSYYPYYDKCMMTHFNVTSSQITQTFFPNCPLSLPSGNPISIKDVQFDNNGKPYVAYRDQLTSVYVVNPTGSNGPIRATSPYLLVQLSLNITNGTFNFVGTQLSSFVLGRVSFTAGTVYQNLTVRTGSYYNSIFKANSQFFMLSYIDKNGIFDLWDVVNFVNVSSVSSNIPLSNIFTTLPGYVLGFNALAPDNYTGVIFWTRDNIYIMNSAGGMIVLDPGNGISVNDVVPMSQTKFFASQYQSYLDGEVMYEIVSWGMNKTQMDFNVIDY